MNLEKENTQEHEKLDKSDFISRDAHEFENMLSKAFEVDEVDR